MGSRGFIERILYKCVNDCLLIFKADTGETFKSYLQRVRCDVAEQLLNSTNMTVLEVSEAIGYKDVKYFQEVFKKYKNVTPKKLKAHFDKIHNVSAQ